MSKYFFNFIETRFVTHCVPRYDLVICGMITFHYLGMLLLRRCSYYYITFVYHHQGV